MYKNKETDFVSTPTLLMLAFMNVTIIVPLPKGIIKNSPMDAIVNS